MILLEREFALLTTLQAAGGAVEIQSSTGSRSLEAIFPLINMKLIRVTCDQLVLTDAGTYALEHAKPDSSGKIWFVSSTSSPAS